jgi:hypothetical protein
VGDTDEFYAAAYNHTVGYLEDIDVNWECDVTTVGQVTSPGNYTTFTAQNVAMDSTCNVTATHATQTSLTNSTGLITVLAPTVDEIRIRDAADGAGNVVGDMTFNAADTDMFYAAGYNKSVWIMDVDATWTSSADSVGTVTGSGTSRTFTAQTVDTDSTCTVTATYNGVSNSTGTLTVRGEDTQGPDQPQTPSGEAGKDSVKLNWGANTEPDLKHYVVQRTEDPDGEWDDIATVNESQTSYEDTGLDPDTTYYYRIVAVDDSDNPSTPSEWVKITTEPEDEFPWLLLILLIIIIIVILIIIILATRKKKEPEAPPAEEPEAAPMEEMEEAPPEEEFMEEEAMEPEGEYEEEVQYEEEPAAEPEGEYEEEVQYEEEPAAEPEGEYEEEVEYEEETEPETPSTPPPPPPPPPPA